MTATRVDLEPKEVYRTVLTVQTKLKKGTPRLALEKDYAMFYMSYPLIMDKALDGTLDMKEFARMVKQAQAVRDGKQTLEETSLAVGKELAKKYVLPKLNNEYKAVVEKAYKSRQGK